MDMITAALAKALAKQYTDQKVSEIQGFTYYICTSGEFNTSTGVPTISSPSATTFYFVPDINGTNVFNEYIYKNNSWVLFGSCTLDPDNYSISWDKITDKPNIDNIPTEDSNNLVKSGGVYDAVSEINERLEDEIERATSEEARIEALFTQPVEQAVSDWLDDHPEATTTVQDGAITYAKLNESIKVGITCSALGMTLNDSNGDNASILANAVNSGKTILVDGAYKLNYSSSFAITSDVIMIGITSNASFISVDGGSLFAPSGNIKVFLSGISFVNSGATTFMLFYVAPSGATNILFYEIVVHKCSFTTSNGQIKLIDYRTVTSTAPSDSFGVNRLLFDSNKLDTVKGMFITFVGVPVRWAEVTRNSVHNHNSVLYYCATENSDIYDAEIKQSRKMLIIKDNFVKNDLDYWCTVTANNYNCLSVCEGYNIIISNNYIEGMHAETNCVMIPFYSSCEYLTYVNNVSVDNAVFSDTASSSTIFRCKGIRTHGIYDGNTFIIHDDYAQKVGKTGFTITHILALEGVQTGTVEIVRNYIYAQTLTGMTFNCQNKELIFDNNVLCAKNWADANPFYSVTANASKTVFITNNKFMFSTYGNGESNTLAHFIYGSSFTGSLNGEQLDSIIIKNNDFNFGNIGFVKVILFRDLQADTIDIQGNRIEYSSGRVDIASDHNALFSSRLITMDNTIIGVYPMLHYQRLDGGDFKSSDIDCSIESINLSDFTHASGEYIFPIPPLTANGTVFIQYKLEIISDVMNEINFSVKYTKSGTAETIVVTSSDGISTTIDPSTLSSSQDVTFFNITILSGKCRVLEAGSSSVAQIRFIFVSYPAKTITRTHIYVKKM